MCLFLCNCEGKWVKISLVALNYRGKLTATEPLTCCGSPSVKGSLVATWNMISLPWKEVKSASLPVWPWHTSSPPLKLRNGSEETSGSDFKYYMSNQHHSDARYPVKPRSSIVSPKMDRNSLNSSLSSLLLSMSSSVSYREINAVREGAIVFQ